MDFVYLTPRALIDKLAPAREKGLLVSAEEVSIRLEKLGLMAQGADLALALCDAANLIRKENTRGALIGSAIRPTHGIAASNPMWAVLIPDHGTAHAERGDGIRLLLLINAVLGSETPSGLRPSVVSLDACIDPIGVDLIDRLNDQIVALIKAPISNGTIALARDIQAVAHRLSLSSNQRQALKSAAERFVEITSVRAVRLAAKQKPFVEPNPVDDGSSIFLGSNSESFEDDLEVLAPSDERGHGTRNERNAIRRSVYLYASCLGRGSAQSLAVEECQVFSEHLLAETENALARNDLSNAGVNLTWLLMLVTSRGMEEVMTANLDALNGPAFAIDVAAGAWRSELTARAKVMAPTEQCLTAPVQKYCDFPLPRMLASLLQKWRALAGVSRLVDVMEDKNTRSDLVEKSRQSLKALLPRISDARIRLTLPVLIQELSQEPCFALLQSGELLGHSSAPLHYFVTDAATAVRHYGAPLDDIGIPIDQDAATSHLVGADLAALNVETVREFRNLLAGRTLRSKHLTSLRAKISSYNAIIRYTAEMIGAAIGHRENNDIGSLCLMGLDPRGWGTFEDKGVYSGASIRPAIVPPLVIRQVENVRLFQTALLRDMPDDVREILKAAISGTGPLLVLIECRSDDDSENESIQIENARPIKASDLQDPWLAERQLPRWFLRTRLRTGLNQAGVPPHLIYFQMGHTYNGLNGTGIDSPASIEEAANALRDKLEQHLARDGWVALPTALTNKKPLATWNRRIHPQTLRRDRLEFEKKWISSWKARRKQEFSAARSTTHIERRAEWIEDCLRDFRSLSTNSISNGVELQDHHIEKWLNNLAALSLSRAAAIDFLRQLRRKVMELRDEKTTNWSGKLPPLMFNKGPDIPPVTYHHVRAAAFVEQARLSLLSEAPKHLSKVDICWARVAGLLITGFSTLNESQLEKALEALLQRNVAHLDREHLITSVELHSTRSQAIRLTAAATSAHRAAQIVTNTPPSVGEILDALKKWVGNGSNDPLKGLFDAQKLAIRIYRPGVMWGLYECEDRNTLSLTRTMLYQQSTIGGPPDELQSTAAPTVSTPRPHRSPAERLKQYRAFRSALNLLREPQPGSQGVVHRRYSKALRLCRDTLKNGGLDDTIAGIVQFSASLLEQRDKRRISTTYDYITGIGAPLLNALGDESLFDLDEDQLEEIVQAVIAATPESRKAGVASRLMQFFRFHEASLSSYDPNWFNDCLGDADGAGPITQSSIVTEAEFESLRRVIDHLGQQEQLSTHDIAAAKVVASLLFRLGLRAGEATHRIVSDVMYLKEVFFLLVHSTPLGLVKTRNAVRLLKIDNFLPPDELKEFHDFYQRALRENADSSRRKSPPLFLTALPGESATDYDARKYAFRDILKLIRCELAVVTGLPRPSLHLLRHSMATRLLASIHMDRSAAPAPHKLLGVSRLLGHGHTETAHRYYWHFDHLTPFHEAPLTLLQRATLEGRTVAAAKKRRQRNARIPETASPANSQPREAVDIESMACLVSQQIVPQPEDFLSFLVRFETGMSVDRAIRSVSYSSEKLAASLDALIDLGKEANIRFVRRDADQSQLSPTPFPAAGNSVTAARPRDVLLHPQTMVPSARTLRRFSRLSERFSHLRSIRHEDARRLIGVARRQLREPSRAELSAINQLGWSKLSQSYIEIDCWLLAILIATRSAHYNKRAEPAN